MNVYIDLNIFDRIEKIHRLESPEKWYYESLLDMIERNQVTTAFSNAHLNDLFRGYQKNPEYINGHLENIRKLTKNLCICQYWGEPKVIWHYQDIFVFFQSKVDEWNDIPNNYEDLFKDFPEMESAHMLYKLIPLPPNFKLGYKDPMYGIMFPLSKIHNHQYALQADIFNFQARLKSDYGLYKAFRSYLVTGLNKIKSNKEMLKSINQSHPDLPKHLEITDLLERYTPNSKTSENLLYSKIVETFFKYDLAGYKSDGHFNNMFDDGLHTFYAAHFDYFITNDDRCKYKAEKTYEKLNISTRVIKIEDIDQLKMEVNN
ncbi:hypothetical protein H9N25_08675 [Pedobacter riviphilus]|uniref:DUF4935 domain-containing protein n=1 Tax=Pedobacter riviphilus TaxID=2766984 RepID=A0ABX6TLM1_9SPHI|nr:hypothetical protein [Pedobacter riviphilus]QNR86449.1 hypothetical protein H9N25_08675 [Pedobacter riviphilus]